MSELVKRLRHLVSLDESSNGGPYGGYAAQQCMEAMRDAAARIEALEQALRDALPILEESYRWHRDAQSHAAIIMRACRAVETARAALAQTGEPIE
jgi:hypothetical protein